MADRSPNPNAQRPGVPELCGRHRQRDVGAHGAKRPGPLPVPQRPPDWPLRMLQRQRHWGQRGSVAAHRIKAAKFSSVQEGKELREVAFALQEFDDVLRTP